jgi:7-carboxy-7-deazaguanine synthase
MVGKLAVSQIFGPTIQGEGSAAGQHCVFLRTFGCNLECRWCDTGYTWAVTPTKAAKTNSGHMFDKDDPKYGRKEMTTDEVITELLKVWNVDQYPTTVVVSGGEPMMQQALLVPVLNVLQDWGNEIHIETAGTIPPTLEFDDLVTQYNVSPKLASSGNLLSKRRRPAALAMLRNTGKAWFKFVLTDHWAADLQEVDNLVIENQLDRRRIMVMPEGTDGDTNIIGAKKFEAEALRRGYGITFRSHVFIWPDDKDK